MKKLLLNNLLLQLILFNNESSRFAWSLLPFTGRQLAIMFLQGKII